MKYHTRMFSVGAITLAIAFSSQLASAQRGGGPVGSEGGGTASTKTRSESTKRTNPFNAAHGRTTPAGTSPAARLVEKGNALVAKSQYDEAISAYLEAARLKPNYYDALYGLGWTYNETQKYDEASSMLKRAIAADGQKPEAHVELGYALRKLDHYSESERAYRQALVLRPNYPTALVQLGDLYYFNLKNYREAAASYEAGLPADTDNANALYNEGWCYNETEQYSRALAPLEKAVRLQPTDSKNQVELAYSYRKLGESEAAGSTRATSLYDQSISTYKEAIRLNSESVSAYTGLGDVEYLDTKRYANALQAYTNAIRLAGDKADSRVLFNAGWCCNELTRYREAVQLLQRATSVKPEYTEAYFELGYANQKLKNYPPAIQAYSEAVRLKPDYGKALYNLGWIYNDTNRFDLAVPYLLRSVRIMPADPAASFELGYAYNQLKQCNEAIPAFRNAVKAKSDYAEAHYQLGVALVCANRRREATEEVEILQGLDPSKASQLLKLINGR